MAFVQFSRVSLSFGERDILKDVNLNLSANSKAALAGANGAGKTTLMKIIAGIIPADSGERAIQKGCRISYLPQSGIVHKGKTLAEEAETAYANIVLMLDKADKIGRELQDLGGGEEASGRVKSLLEEHHGILTAIENSGYYRREAQINQVFTGLGFSAGDFNRQCAEFSGGWQMRIALAKILLENPDIMLLDEPTNYLDIEARNWLESWLLSYEGGCLLVSHDRFFLDTTINEVYEVFQGRVKRYAGNFTNYEKTREQELESLVKRYNAQQQEIEKTEALIRRFRYKASKAAFAQDLIKRLDRMEKIEIPENLKKINITFPLPPHSGRNALEMEGIGRAYGERQVIKNLDLKIDAGEKLLVVGPNGAGKTTLLRIISGEDSAYSGKVKYGTGIKMGYFSQDAAEKLSLDNFSGDRLSKDNLSNSMTVEDYVSADASMDLVPRLRGMLGAFLFRGDDVYKSLSVLSGGEKSRLALLKMLLRPINLLILDEPTNHLDLQSKDILLECLKKFAGTIIFVSHDRSFMEALSTKTLELSVDEGEKRSHRLFYGNYAYYLDRRAAEASLGGNNFPDIAETKFPGMKLPEKNIDTENSGISAVQNIPAAPLISSAEKRELDKQRQTLIRRLERQERIILETMEEMEKEIRRLENELSKPENYSSGEKSKSIKKKLDRAVLELESKSAEWEEAANNLAIAQSDQFSSGSE